jgi:ABC-type uncharacterized transport system substrate-binding protein
MRRRIRLAASTLALFACAAAHAAGAPRIGVLAPGDDKEGQESAAAFVDAWRATGAADADFVQRVVSRDEKDTATALEDMHRENVRLIVAVGDAATPQVRDAVRDVDVVFAVQDAALAVDLRRGGGACVVAGVAPDVVAANLRRAVAGLRRVGAVVPRGDESAMTNARELGAEIDTVVAEVDGATPEARASAAVTKLVPGVDAVWLPPSVSSADAVAVAAALAKRGVPLVGSRRSHLSAGCAIVLRADPSDLGSLAAVLAQKLQAGGDPGKTPPRRARRCRVEANLPAAARLEFAVPLTLLAWADEIWPRGAKARR